MVLQRSLLKTITQIIKPFSYVGVSPSEIKIATKVVPLFMFDEKVRLQITHFTTTLDNYGEIL